MGGALLQQVNRDTSNRVEMFRHRPHGQWHKRLQESQNRSQQSQQGRPLNPFKTARISPPSKSFDGAPIPSHNASRNDSRRRQLLRDQILAEVRAIASSYDNYLDLL